MNESTDQAALLVRHVADLSRRVQDLDARVDALADRVAATLLLLDAHIAATVEVSDAGQVEPEGGR